MGLEGNHVGSDLAEHLALPRRIFPESKAVLSRLGATPVSDRLLKGNQQTVASNGAERA